MRTLLLVLVCLLAFPASILANATADAEYGVKYTQERLITLPQDQGRWYVSLFGDLADPKFQSLQKWFASHDGLVNLRNQVHYNEYSVHTVRYQRYAKGLPATPCIRVQNSRGVVTSEFWSEYIPLSAESLYRGIREDLRDEASWGCLRRRRCRPCPSPRPQPQPQPQPISPDPEPIKDDPPVFADDPKPEPEKESGFPWLLALVAGLIGGGVGVGQGFKEELLDSPAPRVPKIP
jgi:hypothetical protein